MKSLKLIILTLFLFCLMSSVSGQDVTQPLSPQLDYVTVDPYTGYATIRWLPSLSGDVSSYVVYTYSSGTADAVDTIRSPYILEYTHTLSAARYTEYHLCSCGHGLFAEYQSSEQSSEHSFTWQLKMIPADNGSNSGGRLISIRLIRLTGMSYG